MKKFIALIAALLVLSPSISRAEDNRREHSLGSTVAGVAGGAIFGGAAGCFVGWASGLAISSALRLNPDGPMRTGCGALGVVGAVAGGAVVAGAQEAPNQEQMRTIETDPESVQESTQE